MSLLPLETMTRCYNTIGELAAIFMSTPPAPCRALGITEAEWPLYVALEQDRRDALCAESTRRTEAAHEAARAIQRRKSNPRGIVAGDRIRHGTRGKLGTVVRVGEQEDGTQIARVRWDITYAGLNTKYQCKSLKKEVSQ